MRLRELVVEETRIDEAATLRAESAVPFCRPCFWLMGQGLVWAIVGFTILGLVFLPQLGTVSATFPAMFPAHVRYAGMAISYNVSTAASGGTASLVNDGLVTWTGNRYVPEFYMMAAMVIGMIGLVKVPETAGHSPRSGGPG